MELPIKLKRKELDLEGVNDDFSDFSLSSPARKIRRLDGEEMMLMMKEDDEPMVFREVEVPPVEKPTAVPDEVNEERAIVLFNPNPMTPLLQFPRSPPSSFSILVNSGDLGFGSKGDPVIWSRNRSDLLQSLLLNGETGKKQKEEREKQGMTSNGCMAVVPWVPNPNRSQNPQVSETITDDMCMMDDETAAMDIEEDFKTNTGLSPTFTTTHDVGIQGLTQQGLNQWQQQHCMIPQLPQNLQTPISCFGNTDNN